MTPPKFVPVLGTDGTLTMTLTELHDYCTSVGRIDVGGEERIFPDIELVDVEDPEIVTPALKAKWKRLTRELMDLCNSLDCEFHDDFDCR